MDDNGPILLALDRMQQTLAEIRDLLARGMWTCGCGQINSVQGQTCVRCGRRIGETS